MLYVIFIYLKKKKNQHLTNISLPETIHFLQQCGDAGLPYNVIPNDSAGTQYK